jgi:hypothetical protein
MVGTIYETISPRLSRDMGDIPITTIHYDGQESEANDEALDNFVNRARHWRQRRRARA